MRARFWRKKNARLVTRLATVVETAERARQSQAARPYRVEIDTTYIQSEPMAAAESDRESLQPVEAAGEMQGFLQSEPLVDEALASREEAVRRLEAAGRRIAAERDAQRMADLVARHEAEASRQSTDAARQLDAVRQAAAERELALRQEADARLTEASERFETDLRREMAARLTAEAARATIERQLAETTETLTSLERLAATAVEAQRLEAAARAREQIAIQDAAAQHEAATRLGAELVRETAARQSAENALGEAAKRLDEQARSAVIERESIEARARAERSDAEQLRNSLLSELAETQQKSAELERTLREKEAATQGAIETAVREATAKLRALAESELAARQDATAALGAANKRIVDFEREQSAALDWRRRAERAEQLEAELRVSEEAQRLELAGLRERATRAETEIRRERALRIELEAMLESARGQLPALVREVAALRDADRQRHDDVATLAAIDVECDRLRAVDLEPLAEHDLVAAVSPVVSPVQDGQPLDTPAAGLFTLVASDEPACALPPMAPPSAAAERPDRIPDRTGTPRTASPEKRRDRRVASGLPATLWREGMSQAIVCTIRDRSSSGAKLEFSRDRFSNGNTEFVIGDRLTLTMNAGQERTAVTCAIAWIAGNRCGVKYAGQFVTHANVPKRYPTIALDRGASAKSGKPATAVGRLAKGLLGG